jgi:hypothetical protein
MPVWSGLGKHRDHSGLTPCRDVVSVSLPHSIRSARSGNMAHFEMQPFILREVILWHRPCRLARQQALEAKHEVARGSNRTCGLLFSNAA